MTNTGTIGPPPAASCFSASSSVGPASLAVSSDSSQTAVGNAATFFRRAASSGDGAVARPTMRPNSGSTYKRPPWNGLTAGGAAAVGGVIGFGCIEDELAHAAPSAIAGSSPSPKNGRRVVMRTSTIRLSRDDENPDRVLSPADIVDVDRPGPYPVAAGRVDLQDDPVDAVHV